MIFDLSVRASATHMSELKEIDHKKIIIETLGQAYFFNIFKKLKPKKTQRQYFTQKLNASEIFEALAK